MALPWYEKGLRFECTGCGQCCTGQPGYVWISESEMGQAAQYLQISLQEFKNSYTRQINGKYSLLERKRDNQYDCIFLEGKKCKIYHHRPHQCRSFPWWPQNLESQQTWNETAKECEGIHSCAPIHSSEKIQENLEIHEKYKKDLS